MTYTEFVRQIITEGVEVLASAALETPESPQLAGALSACEACLKCDSAPALGVLLAFARNKHADVLREPVPDADRCLFAQGFAYEVEWICNCVSALLLNEGLQPLITPTSRGIMKCAELLGEAPRGVPRSPQWFLDSPAAGTPDCLCSFCGCPIDLSLAMVLRAWDAPRRLELRACPRDACTAAFLSTPFLTAEGVSKPS